MAKKKVEAVMDKVGNMVKVGDWVIVRKAFPYTSKLVFGRVKKIYDKGVFIAGHKEAFNSFYKLADK